MQKTQQNFKILQTKDYFFSISKQNSRASHHETLKMQTQRSKRVMKLMPLNVRNRDPQLQKLARQWLKHNKATFPS